MHKLMRAYPCPFACICRCELPQATEETDYLSQSRFGIICLSIEVLLPSMINTF